MSLNKKGKAELIREISTLLVKAKTVVVAEYRGVTVGAMTELRAKARDEDVYLRVIKNKLFQRAAHGTSFEKLSDQLKGPLIYSVSCDAIASARVLYDFSKKNENMIIRAGIFGNEILNASAVKALAVIPTREVLLTQLLGMIQAPIGNFVRLLSAIKEKKANFISASAEAM